MVLTADGAGTVATRSAGLVEVRATLSWKRPEDAAEGAAHVTAQVARLPLQPGRVRHDLAEAAAEAQDGTTREVSGRLWAMTEGDLGSSLERVMREITAAAAFSDAVLACRAVRVVPPRATPPGVLGALALDLRDAGFRVRFEPSWTPVAAGTVALGALGAEDRMRDFLADHPLWKATPTGLA